MSMVLKDFKEHAQPLSAYDKVKPYRLTCGPETKTKQSMADECNVNLIVRKHGMAALDETWKNTIQTFGTQHSLEYKASLDLVRSADALFEQLPSKVRNKFGGDPQEFLAFMEDEANMDEAAELGLLSQEGMLALEEGKAAAQAAAEAARAAEISDAVAKAAQLPT
nr:MAG: internal scaffolding protein [Microvirus sp.]